MPEPSNYSICYDAVQRVYRNAVIRAARLALIQSYGDDWLKQVEEVFQREWQGVVDAANQIRVAGFVRASLIDDFDCLGVNHFHNLFDRFFDDIFPRPSWVGDAVRQEEKRAVLRYAKEVNDYRNAMSHPSENDLPERDAKRLLDSAHRLLLKIDTDAAERILEYEDQLLRGGPSPPAIAPPPSVVATPTPTIPRGPDQRQDKDTMIQDVNARNARIFFDNYAYVGGCRHMAAPTYFAPYFTKECVGSAQVPEITEDGISLFSEVLHVIEISLPELRSLGADGIDRLVPNGQLRNLWKLGVERIIAREREERFKEIFDPHRLYLLGAPQGVRRGASIKKDGYLPTIPHGFGTAFGRLDSAANLQELKLD